MYKKRWQAAMMYAASVLGNFSVVGFGLAVYPESWIIATNQPPTQTDFFTPHLDISGSRKSFATFFLTFC